MSKTSVTARGRAAGALSALLLVTTLAVPEAGAFTAEGCASRGGFCDASNTCRKSVFVPERGFEAYIPHILARILA